MTTDYKVVSFELAAIIEKSRRDISPTRPKQDNRGPHGPVLATKKQLHSSTWNLGRRQNSQRLSRKLKRS